MIRKPTESLKKGEGGGGDCGRSCCDDFGSDC